MTPRRSNFMARKRLHFGFFEFGTRKGGSLPRDLSVQPVQFRWAVLLSRCGYIISRWSSGRCSRPNDGPADQRTCPSCLCVDSALRRTEPLSSHLHFALRSQPTLLHEETGETRVTRRENSAARCDTGGRQGVTGKSNGPMSVTSVTPTCHPFIGCFSSVSPLRKDG